MFDSLQVLKPWNLIVRFAIPLAELELNVVFRIHLTPRTKIGLWKLLTLALLPRLFQKFHQNCQLLVSHPFNSVFNNVAISILFLFDASADTEQSTGCNNKVFILPGTKAKKYRFKKNSQSQIADSSDFNNDN